MSSAVIGAGGYLGFAEESTYGTAVAASTAWLGRGLQRGRYAEPPGNFGVFIGVSSPDFTSEQGPTIRQYLRRGTVQIDGWGTVTDDTTANRSERGELLAEEIIAALETARVDNTYVGGLFDLREISAEGITLDGDFDPVPQGYCRCVIQFHFAYARDTGL